MSFEIPNSKSNNNDSILYGRNNISNTKYHDHGQIHFTFISTWILVAFKKFAIKSILCVCVCLRERVVFFAMTTLDKKNLVICLGGFGFQFEFEFGRWKNNNRNKKNKRKMVGLTYLIFLVFLDCTICWISQFNKY